MASKYHLSSLQAILDHNLLSLTLPELGFKGGKVVYEVNPINACNRYRASRSLDKATKGTWSHARK